MRKIAAEEHFYTEEYLKYRGSRRDYGSPNSRPQQSQQRRENTEQTMRLIDLGEGRLEQMDKAGISMQVLSLSVPGVEDFDASDGIKWARKTNDELSKTIRKYPDRFAGLAAIPMQDPKAAAEELERAVKELGLRGAKTHSHVQGEYLDDSKYWVVFEKAHNLNVPIYLHPREPSPDMIKPYLAYPGLEAGMLGYGAGTALMAMRLILSGLFDEYPRLKIILGHLGEALPFWQWRLDNRWQLRPNTKNIRRKLGEYLKDNFFFTTSGMFSLPALLCVYMMSGADNILFAVDYPMESNEQAIQFMDSAPICESDKEKIYHLNTERLLAL